VFVKHTSSCNTHLGETGIFMKRVFVKRDTGYSRIAGSRSHYRPIRDALLITVNF
jgi:hypothetical protein